MRYRLVDKIFNYIYYSIFLLTAIFVHQYLLPQLSIPYGLMGIFWRDMVIKNLYWTIPALLLMAASPVRLFIPLNRLFQGEIKHLALLAEICVITCMVYTLHLLASGGSRIVGQNIPAILLYSVCAGTTEEFLFRGFFLNQQVMVYPQKIALLINAVMFVLIHYTSTAFRPVFWTQICSLRSLLIFVMGLFLGKVFLKSRNLAAPMLLHTYWNILSCWWGLTG